MTIESNIFRQFIPDFNKLMEYGFKYNNGKYYLEKKILNNEFKAVIEITKEGNVSGTVYDIENNDEYLPLRIEHSKGKFVGNVRLAYEQVLTNIRNYCFNKSYFASHQANRIAGYIKQQYNNEPEFLWEKFPGYGVFRSSHNNKWYGIIMNIDRNKLEDNHTGEIEIINIKLEESKIHDLLKKKGGYPAYHMNKKHWITILLNETLNDDIILKLIDKSYKYTSKIRKKN